MISLGGFPHNYCIICIKTPIPQAFILKPKSHFLQGNFSVAKFKNCPVRFVIDELQFVCGSQQQKFLPRISSVFPSSLDQSINAVISMSCVSDRVKALRNKKYVCLKPRLKGNVRRPRSRRNTTNYSHPKGPE